jgi:hypothetical protein
MKAALRILHRAFSALEGQVTRITGIVISAADLGYRSTLMTKVKAERAIADTPEAEVLRSLLP